jgi:hypothetical protein
MTHTVHPYSHRLGIIRDWKSRWFGVGSEYREFLKSDVLLREYLEKKLRGQYVSGIEMERNQKALRIIIETSRPGMIIGRNGEGAVKMREDVLAFLAKKKLAMRKPVLPLLFLLFTPIAISAQGFYFPEGKTTWIETGWWQNPDLVGFNFGGASNACQMDRDTLIGGKIYRNISLWRVDSQYTYLGDHFDTTYLNEKIADAGAVRSDSTGRIYYYHYVDGFW